MQKLLSEKIQAIEKAEEVNEDMDLAKQEKVEVISLHITGIFLIRWLSCS